MVQMSGGLPFDAATVARVNVEGCGFKLQHPARAVLCFAHGVILQRVPGRAPGWVGLLDKGGRRKRLRGGDIITDAPWHDDAMGAVVCRHHDGGVVASHV